jgi:hypothetical protein
MNRVAASLAFAGLLSLPAMVPGQTPTTPAKPARPARTRTPAASVPRPPLDFSGVWELDPKASIHPNPHYEGAVLSVTQNGDHIWIQPIKQGKGTGVLGEEIVADGRGYEKGIGAAGKGIVTAGWSADRQSLWIEVKAGPADPAKGAMQRSVWKLSEDGSVWVRESVSISQGKAQSSRLVFRRRSAGSLTPTPAPPKSRPGKS